MVLAGVARSRYTDSAELPLLMRVGFALRSTVFNPSAILEASAILDRAGVEDVWFPDVGGSYDAVDLCALALGATHNSRFGTGVLRVGEQDPRRLALRARTLTDSSGGRFVLGLGAGVERGPSAVRSVVDLSDGFRKAYGAGAPPVFYAALRASMLREAVSSADGAILNFCPPSYVTKILPRDRPPDFTVACYVKVFFSQRGDSHASRMLLEEVSSYNRYPGYHKMFEDAGVAEVIAGLEPGAYQIPSKILEFALSNPSPNEVHDLLEKFYKAGVDIPVVYPYVDGMLTHRMDVLGRLAELATLAHLNGKE